MYVSCFHGHFGTKVHRSEDGGHVWEEVACPEYPARPEGLEEREGPLGMSPPPWKLHKIWALQAGHESRSGELWCGTIPGGLFRSGDSGASWELNRPLWEMEARLDWFGGGEDWPGIHSIGVDPRDSDRLMVAVSCGGVWETRDGGNSWQSRAAGMVAEYMPPEHADNPNIQDPHCVAWCQSDPGVMWAQHHNGVFVSRNGGKLWHSVEDIDPSVFGFAVAVHPRDGDMAWLVPAVKDECRIPVDGKVVVTRTRDGGKTWQALSDGLPQEDAYDIVFRHALDVDASGDKVAFGSTTGSLWISENQGDGWETFSTNLPPVYCVRFAEGGS